MGVLSRVALLCKFLNNSEKAGGSFLTMHRPLLGASFINEHNTREEQSLGVILIFLSASVSVETCRFFHIVTGAPQF